MEDTAGWGIQQESYISAEHPIQSAESHNVADTFGGNENPDKRLADNIRAQLNSNAILPLVSGCLFPYINRVPHHIRSVNPQAYTPMFVSIGPVHHFNEKLQSMEKQKSEFVNSYLVRTKIELELLVRRIREMEGMIRCCYAETYLRSMSSDDFVKMILLDGIFILELFNRRSSGSFDTDTDESGRLRRSLWELDLILLENQLPFFVLEELFSFTRHLRGSSLIKLASMFFSTFNVQSMHPVKEIRHFTDLVRIFQLRQKLFRTPGKGGRGMLWYSATELHDAGVKFGCSGGSGGCVLDLLYEKGVLQMGHLVLDDQTEALARNIMALEQFCRWDGEDQYLSDNFLFLDSLINTIEDINLLCDRGILVNKLVDNKAALSMIKNLVTNIKLLGPGSDLLEICNELNQFYRKPLHRWRARLSVTTLKNQYFNNPWRGAGTIAACLLLLLTLIQTIMSILQVAKA